MQPTGENTPFLGTGEFIKTNEKLKSSNGLFELVIQADGNVVVYRGSSKKAALWSILSEGLDGLQNGEYELHMQTDGNLVVYRHNPATNSTMYPAFWGLNKKHPDVLGTKDCWLKINDDGNVALGPNKGDWKSRKWSSDVVDGHDEDSIELEKIEYDLSKSVVTQIGPPRQSLSQIATNNTDVAQSQPMSITYTKTESKGWKVSTSLKIGTKTTLETGIPGIVDGKVEMSAEVTTGFEWNQTTTETNSVTVSLVTTVPPHSKIRARNTWTVSSITLPYKVLGKVKFHGHNEKLPFALDGVYNGIASHDLETVWENVQ